MIQNREANGAYGLPKSVGGVSWYQNPEMEVSNGKYPKIDKAGVA